MCHDRDILICDDEKVHSTVIRFYLQRAGINNPVIYFENGKALLEYLRTGYSNSAPNRPLPMVLLDVIMPQMDGIQILSTIKSDPMLKKISVIMITTTDDPADIDKCTELGCEGFVTKPIEYKLFSAAVLRAMLQPVRS